MSDNNIFVGKTPLHFERGIIESSFVSIDSQNLIKITNYDQMSPFFMTIVSHAEHWMFISSNGGLTAGRRNAENSLFPYYTDDKITDSADTTGSKTIFLVNADKGKMLWEPFAGNYPHVYNIQRNIYKHIAGNMIVFEEINYDLDLTFRYSWEYSDKYGFVKKSTLINNTRENRKIDVLDGIQNIMPCGVDLMLQNVSSTLIDAYKKNELDRESGVGMIMLSAIITDKAEPSEALKTNTVWSSGLRPENILLCSDQLDIFRRGEVINHETDIRARRGAYFVNSTIELEGDTEKSWFLVAEINQDATSVAALNSFLKNEPEVINRVVNEDIGKGRKKLMELIGIADGHQLTADKITTSRHLSNVMFNIMRGGIFEEQYEIERSDLLDFIQGANQKVFDNQVNFLKGLPENLNYNDWLKMVEETGSSDLVRLAYEYLPLTFSRRHGDPSRPWNRFSIDIQDEDGTRIRNYEGNWRDIFQNWEALAMSFPAYLESMIGKFVNASTLDGYNPYRITKKGIDWETIEPDDPWSFIGYWGDHQIIYLLKLMELSKKYHPGQLEKLLNDKRFSYANVPYRIKGYEDLVKDPQDTVDFEHDLEKITQERVTEVGSDGKLVWNEKGDVIKANFMEKLLVSLLAKLSNFVPEAGIWLNTQRPEWNDANNALVGNGASMVTLYYIRRFLTFLKGIAGSNESYLLSAEIADLLAELNRIMKDHQPLLDEGGINGDQRRKIVDKLGSAGEKYRSNAYDGLSGNEQNVSSSAIVGFCELSLLWVDHSIRSNRRSDGLYHAYNLIKFEKNSIRIDHLYEMLEGQVAVLSSGFLTPEQALEVLEILKSSDIYREDQYSYMLYPNRQLPLFLEKNNIPASFSDQSKLFKKLLEDGNKDLVTCDIRGAVHFNGNFNNAKGVNKALDQLITKGYGNQVNSEREQILDIFEKMFNHYAFTGRSGTFYGYEGLGSIYWHMVSKLVLAIAENYHWAKEKGADVILLGKLIERYYDTRAGIGMDKSPELYGAFPTDPYSHTPGNGGAKQPGMTGQVKEDVISRWLELGLFVEKGNIYIQPDLLRKSEFLSDDGHFEYFSIDGQHRSVSIKKNQLAFTWCQVPFIYENSSTNNITIFYKNGNTVLLEGNKIDNEYSKDIFNRTDNIENIVVRLVLT